MPPTTWNERLLLQGPWDEENEPLSLSGAPSLPMPVKISDAESLHPFFSFLRANTAFQSPVGVRGKEPYYNVDMIEFNKGVLYEDRRMDLCKMVVGPKHISSLMDALEPNDYVKHFLLGNNIIGPAGAQRLSSFIHQFPDRMETWYLAGNCIDTPSFSALVTAMVRSTVLHSVWLKRNPLHPEAADDIFRLITECRNLRTLDLDQTELGDKGVAQIFTLLAQYAGNIDNPPLALRHVYLNATGVGKSACEALNTYLTSPSCTLESLFLANNPIGDAGLSALSRELSNNRSLQRLSLSSCGLKDPGASALLEQLSNHPVLAYLDLGQSYATDDLGMRYNYFSDAIAPVFANFVFQSPSIRVLKVGTCPLSHEALSIIASAVQSSKTLFHYTAKSAHPPPSTSGKGVSIQSLFNTKPPLVSAESIRAVLTKNIQAYYGEDMTYQGFEEDPLRFWRNTADVRFIDSVYRNRDAGMARRRLMVLDKWWDEGDETLEMVAAQGA